MPYGGNKKNNHISKNLNRKTFHSTYIKKDRSSFLKKQNNQRNLRRKAKNMTFPIFALMRTITQTKKNTTSKITHNYET